MSERDGYPQGTPCWADISTGDPEGGRAFYGALFGWDWEINPDPNFGGYSMALMRGKRVVGLAGKMDDNQPTAWVTYFAVDDADKFAAAVPDAGGTMASPIIDIADQGRMAIATDPTGAFFGVWQQMAHRGSELVTTDLDRAAAFYGATLGVALSDMDTGDSGMVYKLLEVDGRTAGGAMPPQPGMENIPPHWGIYFEVADTDATVARAQELGAKLLSPVTQTPQGPMAALLDPQGGAFAIIASGSTE
jgi:uncharacterized protein